MPRVEDQERRLARWVISSGVWFLVGLLLITIALIVTAREERLGNPSITNVRASGFAAFAELLERDGYKVSIDRAARPDFGDADLVIATSFDRLIPTSFSEMIEQPAEEPGAINARPEPHERTLQAYVEDGGKALKIVTQRNFELASRGAENGRTVEAVRGGRTRYLLSLSYGSTTLDKLDYDDEAYDAWFLGDYPYVSYAKKETGTLVTVADGLPLTNRFLDEHQNAEFFLNLIRALVPPGARIDFYEAGIGNAETPTVANTLGPWAVAARTQAILLFIVLIVTFGKRFGKPIVEKRRVRSSRELFDAVADVFRRTRNTGLALDHLLIECDQRMRLVMRLPMNTTRHDMLMQVPQALREQYLNVSELAVSGASPTAATQAAAKLLQQMEGFENDSRAARGLKR